ncbi:map [Wigglesworthia glossinidia endosymbiont of Glossina brevipalpis]|uniref:Methionine aminopeptidase n=1 Tax=Wigglesworthia glossinidia brevipalpis TaxID=36870 RepID=Q8D2G1_WIGBR|nr:map [Wigglesworthia glossinidia endosymbiont of Glossina brevipalpis]
MDIIMSIDIKSTNEIIKIRKSCKIASEVLTMIENYIEPGISTEKLNKICHEYIVKKKHAFPASLGYCGFPKSVCISINDVVCHGIPNKKIILKDGDILNIDVAVIKDEYYGDTSKMFFVKDVKKEAIDLCKSTQKSLYLAIKKIHPGMRLRKIGSIIQKYIESKNYSIVREYCGHGIGKCFHEEPQILHYDAYDKEIKLKPGMIFTIEPMVNIGSKNVYTGKDGWTVKTKDKSLSAQYEHTILITNYGCEVMTLREEELLLKQ